MQPAGPINEPRYRRLDPRKGFNTLIHRASRGISRPRGIHIGARFAREDLFSLYASSVMFINLFESASGMRGILEMIYMAYCKREDSCGFRVAFFLTLACYDRGAGNRASV